MATAVRPAAACQGLMVFPRTLTAVDEPRRAAPRWVTWALVLLGTALAAAAVTYAFVPSHSLPPWVPGYRVGSSRLHHGHALLLAGMAAVVFVGAWQSTWWRVSKP